MFWYSPKLVYWLLDYPHNRILLILIHLPPIAWLHTQTVVVWLISIPFKSDILAPQLYKYNCIFNLAFMVSVGEMCQGKNEEIWAHIAKGHQDMRSAV